MFKRFGEIIVINTLVSIILTLTVLPVLLAYWGPTGAQRLFLLFSQILGLPLRVLNFICCGASAPNADFP